ncbi:MAG: nickel-dependent hydrogenase large subunit [Acidobacteria bacterium]|nr:nickel-dependent hydrogenase large subunit [Acidobacteriota bacterium]
MSSTLTLNVPLNRVEGDLEISAEVREGRVTDAWCSGTMFRGIEKVLLGRGALDGLVITPRICGICSTGHLAAAALALDAIAGIAPPPDAVRLRNVLQMTEHLQSDLRQSFLTFAGDFAGPAHRQVPGHADAVRRYEPFKGETVLEVMRETQRLLEIIAIVGGQWPHASYMVPGGIVSAPSQRSRLQCRLILRQFRSWYERRILGCTLERFAEVRSRDALQAWLEERESHASGDLGFFIAFARALGLHQVGAGPGSFLSYGALPVPEDSAVRGVGGSGYLVPPGFLQGGEVRGFDPWSITEHVAHSWYVDYEGGLHPSVGETRPYASGNEGRKYSWAKAPRYEGQPAETGPLAELVLAGHPLISDLMKREGPSAFLRQLARILRPSLLLPAMDAWLAEAGGPLGYYRSPGPIHEGEACGLTHASRGALGHWVRIEGGEIAHYQIITPTAWNASPRDSAGRRGPIEEALVGTPVADPEDPVELGYVVRSFDVCLVCTVHSLRRGRPAGRLRLGT